MSEAMEPSRPTWRSHPFKPGQVFVAKESFAGWPDNEFVAGREYIFESATYSHYDSSTVFNPARCANKGLKQPRAPDLNRRSDRKTRRSPLC